jgi:MFS family permease
MTIERKPLLSANLRWFLPAMILANIAGQMGHSVLSLYLIDLGADVAQVGLVRTLASLVPTGLQILGGWLCDTVGRLRMIAIGSSVAVLGYLTLVLAPSWEWVLLGLCLERVSKSVVGPSFSAYVAEQSSEEERGRVSVVTKSIYLVVTVVGPALAGFLAYSGSLSQRQASRSLSPGPSLPCLANVGRRPRRHRRVDEGRDVFTTRCIGGVRPVISGARRCRT